MEEEELFEAMAHEMREVTASQPVFHIEITPQDAFMLLGMIQLAMRHPGLDESQRAVGVRHARSLQNLFMQTRVSCPAIIAVCELGWLDGRGEPQ